MTPTLYLGCPIWGNKAWIGEFFTRKAKARDFLEQYGTVFNTVEGNTTFYALPRPETVERWNELTPEHFQFCFKFPKTISHEKALLNAEKETEYFLELFRPLQKKLGPLFLQLPPVFGAERLHLLQQYLESLPSDFSYAVEVRHPVFFEDGRVEAELEDFLAEKGIDRVLFDSRGVHSASKDDPVAQETQSRKPKLPVRTSITGHRPFLRYIAHPKLEQNQHLLDFWVEQICAWLEEGLTPYIFMHTPDDFYAPHFARHLYQKLQEKTHLQTLPPWPAEQETPIAEQLTLF